MVTKMGRGLRPLPIFVTRRQRSCRRVRRSRATRDRIVKALRAFTILSRGANDIRTIWGALRAPQIVLRARGRRPLASTLRRQRPRTATVARRATVAVLERKRRRLRLLLFRSATCAKHRRPVATETKCCFLQLTL